MVEHPVRNPCWSAAASSLLLTVGSKRDFITFASRLADKKCLEKSPCLVSRWG